MSLLHIFLIRFICFLFSWSTKYLSFIYWYLCSLLSLKAIVNLPPIVSPKTIEGAFHSKSSARECRPPNHLSPNSVRFGPALASAILFGNTSTDCGAHLLKLSGPLSAAMVTACSQLQSHICASNVHLLSRTLTKICNSKRECRTPNTVHRTQNAGGMRMGHPRKPENQMAGKCVTYHPDCLFFHNLTVTEMEINRNYERNYCAIILFIDFN